MYRVCPVTSLQVFERVEHDEHDDITYAPEIQSVEIPPDQMSENSDNYQESFDRAAAEGVLDSAKAQTLKPVPAQKPAAQVSLRFYFMGRYAISLAKGIPNIFVLHMFL
ncbi:unnamed protein product [Strongylus vulgaris]|uniref:Uncharacterized protein n=1 Tax=Strongylus vulgaris TaxID=40348 RepID=A0A3P7JBY0_STRVU|nr:unnamed protein product [Strongylus vulgaris]